MELLTQKSLDLIRKYQSKEGAFVASPNFETYQYSWFRDGSFCALALMEYGFDRDAWRFFEWGSGVVLRYQAKIESSIAAVRSGGPLVASECFHSRFTLQGYEVPGNWGHNQLDGLGTWLWALGEFQQRFGAQQPLTQEVRRAAGLVAGYLSALWQQPCSDCWEENEDKLHTYTLAAVAAGLRSEASLLDDAAAAACADEVKRFVLEKCVTRGAFVKSIGLGSVDANLMGLYWPYALVEWDDPIFQKTLRQIEQELLTPGLHRYRLDSYYGGGEWVLLTAWLGWAYARAGERQKAHDLLAWTQAQANAAGWLPEQVPHGLFKTAGYAEWVKRWGEIATPLLWSHAQYLLLVKSLQNENGTEAA